MCFIHILQLAKKFYNFLMVKFVLFATILALAMGCGCQQGGIDDLELDPASALDFFRGFVFGAQDSHCYSSTCYVNVTYAVAQVQSAITTIESLINNFNPADLLPIVCNFNTIFNDFGEIPLACKQAGLTSLWRCAARRLRLARLALLLAVHGCLAS